MKQRRLFFALWPDAVTRRRLDQAAHHWSHHPVAAANLHMTLAFLGNCSGQQQQCFAEAASKIICKPFELELNYLGGWPRSRTQWLGTSCVPAPLGELVAALKSALEPCGFVAEAHRFVAHVTLSRKEKSPRIQAGLQPLNWKVEDFVLVESLPVEGGVRYEVRERWPLAGG